MLIQVMLRVPPPPFSGAVRCGVPEARRLATGPRGSRSPTFAAWATGPAAAAPPLYKRAAQYAVRSTSPGSAVRAGPSPGLLSVAAVIVQRAVELL